MNAKAWSSTVYILNKENNNSSNTGALISDIFNYQPCEAVVSFSLLVISLVLVQQSSDKFCENRSLFDKSAKFCITKEHSVISDFKMGTT